MRHYQRGISTLIILILFLITGVAIASAVFIFSNQQKLNSVNSFTECAKLYPVMESYPAQCNTPDGRHFVQELTDEEKKKLVPPIEASSPANLEGWKVFKDPSGLYEFSYPKDWELSGKECGGPHIIPANSPTKKYSIMGFCGPYFDTTAKEQSDYIGAEDTLISKENVAIGGRPAFKKVLKVKNLVSDNEYWDGYETQFYVDVDKQTLLISIINYEGGVSSANDKEFNEIIRSVKFLK